MARKPLRRTKQSSYARRDRDFEFMQWARRQPCIVRELAPSAFMQAPDAARETPCSGRVEADHMGERGLSHKADDTTCVGICRQHHRERTDHAGTFRALTRDEARAWRAAAIAQTQAAWAARPR